MKRFLIVLVASAGLLLATTACKNPSKGALGPKTRTELYEVAVNDRMAVEDKMHILCRNLSVLIKEAAAFQDERKAYEHLQTFLTDNEEALKGLATQIDHWQKHLSDEERVAAISRLLSKPYANSLKRNGDYLRNRLDYDPKAQRTYDRVVAPLVFHR